jgi:hypothetical protein
MPTETDVKLGEDIRELGNSLAAFRVEVVERFSAVHAELAEFRGEIKTDLRWIKGIGASLLVTGLAFAGWVIADLATLRTTVQEHGVRLDKVEKRLDGIDAKLDVLLRRTEPKTGG